MDGPVTAFFEDRIIARGDRAAVTRALEQGWPNDQAQVRVFDDATGRPVDLDLWDASPPRNGEGDRPQPKAKAGGGVPGPGPNETKPVIPAKAGIQNALAGDKSPVARRPDSRLREDDEEERRAPADAPRPRGRPRLGVIAREVTLLPRHWDWLAAQPGGASAALRRLVESARKQAPAPAQARDAVYRFLTEMAGDRPGYEEAIRALYRGDEPLFHVLIAEWPEDVREYAEVLLKADAD